jgi:hypothetical protein
MSSFSKKENKKVNRSCQGEWYQWEGENIRKGCRRVHVVEISHTYT